MSINVFKKTLFNIAMSTTILFSCSVLAEEATEEVLMDKAEALALDAKYYSAMYNVDQAEAMRRLLIMHGTQDEIDSVEKEFEGQLAGIYFDNGPDFGLKVVLTGDEAPQDPKLLRQARKADRKAERQAQRQARRNEKFDINDADVEKAAQLIEQPTEFKVKFKAKAKAKQNKREQRRKLEQSYKEINESIVGVVGTYFSDEDNLFVVQVNESIAKNAGLTNDKLAQIATSIVKSPARVDFVDGSLTEQSFKGGSSLRTADGSRALCTSGFTVKDRSNGRLGIITAAHCEAPIITYTDKDGSNFQMSRMKYEKSGKNDMAFYSANQTASPSFYADSSNKPRALVGWKSVSETEQKGSLVTGSFICHYGQTTAVQSCGEVVDKNYTPRISNAAGTDIGCGSPNGSYVACGPNFVQVKPKVKAGQETLQCDGGDSGGPWFAYGNAYGIHKAGSDDSNGNCAFAVYTPIIRINDLDLTLYYGK